MTHPSPQEASVLLILGELRGDVKGLVSSFASIQAHINAVEETSDARFTKLEGRVRSLEEIKLKVGAVALGVGLAAGLLGPKLPVLLKLIGV